MVLQQRRANKTSTNKGIELERNFTSTLSSNYTESSLGNQGMVRWDRQSIKLTHLVRRYDIIPSHASLTDPMKPVLVMFLNNAIQPEVWLSVESWRLELSERLIF